AAGGQQREDDDHGRNRGVQPARKVAPEADTEQPGQEALRFLVHGQAVDPLRPPTDPGQRERHEDRGEDDSGTERDRAPASLPDEPQGRDRVLWFRKRAQDKRNRQTRGDGKKEEGGHRNVADEKAL